MRAVLIGMAALISTAAGEAGEAHYVLIFGSQTAPRELRYVHTFATLVRVAWDDAAPSRPSFHVHTISWMPATLDVRVWSREVEPGVNLNLEQTLQFVLSQGQRVRLFGPFQVRREMYERSLVQWGRLERRELRYKAIDWRTDLTVADCIHAIADVDPVFGRGHYPLIRVGWAAARHLADQVITRSPIDQGQVEASWLVGALGLNRYPIDVVSPRQLQGRALCIAAPD